jgi:hypothetical protein
VPVTPESAPGMVKAPPKRRYSELQFGCRRSMPPSAGSVGGERITIPAFGPLVRYGRDGPDRSLSIRWRSLAPRRAGSVEPMKSTRAFTNCSGASI